MIYQKHCNIRGIILVDILLALSMCMFFVIAISESSAYSREIFYKARERSKLLDKYEEILMNPPDQENVDHDIVYRAGMIPYGNIMDQIDVNIGAGAGSYSSTSIRFTSLVTSSSTTTAILAEPICTVDFGDSTVVGSYEWYKHRAEDVARDPGILPVTTVNIVTYVFPINPSIPLTDIEVRSDTVYVSADSNVTLDPDIFVFRIRREVGQEPGIDLLSYLNTGPGISSISIAGKYIFGAVPSTVGQIHILMQSPDHGLSLIKKFQLPLPYATATPALGSAIAYRDNTIYLGTEKWVGEELSAIDISDPALPVRRLGYEIGSKVNDIFGLGGKLYVSTASDKQLQIFDFDGWAKLEPYTSFIPSGWQRQEGKVSSVFEGVLSFGRTSGGYNVAIEHEIFQFSTSTLDMASQTSDLTLPSSDNSADVSGGVYGILKDRSSSYVITRQNGAEFGIYSNNLNASSSLKFPLPSAPQAMTCYRDKIYVLSHTKPEFYEISLRRKYSE